MMHGHINIKCHILCILCVYLKRIRYVIAVCSVTLGEKKRKFPPQKNFGPSMMLFAATPISVPAFSAFHLVPLKANKLTNGGYLCSNTLRLISWQLTCLI